MRTTLTRCTVLIICAVPLGAMAQDANPNGFWGGGEIGVAHLNIARSKSGSYSPKTIPTNFRAGYHWGPKYYAAIELGGWNLESSGNPYRSDSDPNQGVGLEQFMLAMRYYSDLDRPWFLHGGVGQAKYWTNHVGENGGSGKAFELGAGWDIPANSVYFTPTLMLSAGNISGVTSPPGTTQDFKYHAVSLMIGVTLR